MESFVQRNAANLEGACILVVEDEASLRELLAEALTELGCHVSACPDGMAALRAVTSDTTIDLIVTDVGLPGLNGCDMALAARVARPDIPVLFMTGQGDPGPGEMFPDEIWALMEAPLKTGPARLAAGMEVIGKPFTLAALATRLQRMLSGRADP